MILTCPVFPSQSFLERWLPKQQEEPVRKSRFSDEQMVAILREADRTSVAETAKKHKVSDQTIYAWRKHFGALSEGPCGWAKSTGSSLTRGACRRGLTASLQAR